MFGFGLKDKAKKILNNHFNRDGGWTPSWLNSIVSRGKSQGYNEYDVVVWYLLNDWQWSIDTWKDRHDAPETRNEILQDITKEIDLLNQISHLAHQDTGFQSKVNEIQESLKLLK